MFIHKNRQHLLAIVSMLLVMLVLPLGNGCDDNDGEGGMMGGDHMMSDDQNDNDDHMMGEGMMGEGMPEWMMSHDEMMGGDMMRDMRVIRQLLMSHEEIERTVEDVPGGVRTVTTSSNPDLARFIRTHVRQMKERVEEGQPIRMMDPLFREIFEHNDEIDMRIEDIEGGVRVVETSENTRVTKLIRQHAKRAVSEFVDEGMQRAMEPTPLPEGYESD